MEQGGKFVDSDVDKRDFVVRLMSKTKPLYNSVMEYQENTRKNSERYSSHIQNWRGQIENVAPNTITVVK